MSEKRKATIFDLARFYKGHNCLEPVMGNRCEKCGLACDNNGTETYCIDFILKYPDKASEIILKWCDEHSGPTRQSEFLKLFPKTLLDVDGTPLINPCHLDKGYVCSEKCAECRKDYWNEEIER